MNTFKKNAHLSQLKELVEVITIMSCLALLTDSIWCLHDIIVNGLSCIMAIILLSLTISTVITFLAVCRYHKTAVKRILKERLKIQLELNKKSIKRKKLIKTAN